MSTAQEPKQSVFREAHLRDYWKVVWQGRWTVLAIFIIVVGAAVAWSYIQPKVYRAAATVEIQPNATRMMSGQDVSGLGAGGYGWFAEEKYHNTQIEVIRSRDVAERVVKLLRLDKHPDFEFRSDPVDAFRKMIRIDPRRDTGLLEISISGGNPREITQWVNAVTNEYVDRNFELAKKNVAQAVSAIGSQIGKLQDQLSEAEEVRIDALADTDTQIYNSETQEEIVRQRLTLFNAELNEVQVELNQIAETLRQVRRMRAEGADLMSIPELAEDPTLQSLYKDKVELDRQLEAAKVEMRPGHPEFEEMSRQLQIVEKRIADKVGLVLSSLENRYDTIAQKENYLHAQIDRDEQYSVEVAKASSRYDIVKTNAETKKGIFDVITKTMNEVQLSAGLMTNNVQVLDEAVPPLYPIKPRKRLNVMVGAMFGLFLGVAAVFFLDYLDNTIRTPEDVEKFLGLSVLGVVPKMGEQGMAHRGVRESYQSLRTSVIFSSKNRQRKIILVTSTGAQEGKSSTVANLGRTLAAGGDRVIILDCDLRRPKQHIHHGLQREPGLTNYIASSTEDHDWMTYTQTSDPASLHLLACGPIPPSPPELLGNTRFTELLAELREQYDWILIDSPPSASLADGALLASLSDMIMVVVKYNGTDRDVVVKTVQQLSSINPNIAGVVLNKVDLEKAYHKDYYYASYYYAEEDPEDGSKKTSRKRSVQKKAQVG